MKIQIVNFQLDGIDEDTYRGTCDELAPAFAAVPGLAAKLWLADRSANTYGGVYVFSDADAQAAYANSELFAAVAGNPNLTGLTSRAFDVLAGPTAVTRGGLLDAGPAGRAPHGGRLQSSARGPVRLGYAVGARPRSGGVVAGTDARRQAADHVRSPQPRARPRLVDAH